MTQVAASRRDQPAVELRTRSRRHPMIDPLIGQALAQDEERDRLGRGGMSAVYRALQSWLGRQVATKVLPLGQLPDPTLLQRFRREARTAANLLHPNIVLVNDFGE